MNYDEILKKLKSMADPKNVAGMARFGITPNKALGVSIYDLRPLAKKIGKNHSLALKLWSSGIHEARILASYVDEPEKVSEEQLERWVKDFDSWDVVDQVSELIAKTPHVFKKIKAWSSREEEFVKRTAFALMAEIAWHDKTMADKKFEQFFDLIKKAVTDERNYVRKAVNWALRNIGKRNKFLNKRAIQVAKEIQSASQRTNSKSARWIAADALRELTSEKIQKRLAVRSAK